MEPKVQKQLSAFFGKFPLESFVKESAVVTPDNDRGVFFLTKGTVKMTGRPKKKGAFTLNIYKSPALFPMFLVFGQKDKHFYSALSDVEGHFAPPSVFAKFLRKNPTILWDLLKRIYRGLEGFFLLLEVQLSGNAYLKTLAQIIIHSRRFGHEKEGVVVFDWHLTHEQIASQTGLARESVTKEIRKLQKKGLIGYRGKRLFVNDPGKLEEEYFNFSSNI